MTGLEQRDTLQPPLKYICSNSGSTVNQGSVIIAQCNGIRFYTGLIKGTVKEKGRDVVRLDTAWLNVFVIVFNSSSYFGADVFSFENKILWKHGHELYVL